MTVAILAAYIPSQGDDSVTFGPNQLSGIPDWLPTTRYDIEAKVSEADLPKWRNQAQQLSMLRAMLQALLVDRFRLAVHREVKEMPVYEMTVGTKGPKFKFSESTAPDDIHKNHPNAITMIGGMVLVPGPNPGQQTLLAVTMPGLCKFLSNMAGRPIVDKTGLTGRYDISYQLDLPSESAAVTQDFFSSQISTIAREQLGLEIKAAKGPVESLVVDHVERPSEN